MSQPHSPVPYAKKYQDILGLHDFPQQLTTLVKETRLLPLSQRTPTTPFSKWTIVDALVQVQGFPIKKLPVNSDKEYPLSLLLPPTVCVGKEGCKLQKQMNPVLSHYMPEFEESQAFMEVEPCTDVNEFSSDSIYVLEKVLFPKADPQKGNEAPEQPKKLSQAIFIGLDHTSETPINYMVITFGRKNGASNLACLQYKNSEGQTVVTSTEKLFQGQKAASVNNLNKVMEILNAENGLKAKQMAGAKGLPMSDAERVAWDAVSLQKMLEAKLCCLGDEVFHKWFAALDAFTLKHEIPEILFLEVGDDKELQYTCGMMGDRVLDYLEGGNYILLYNKFGAAQDLSQGTMRNTSGVVMMKLFELYKENRELKASDWAELMNLETLFPLKIEETTQVPLEKEETTQVPLEKKEATQVPLEKEETTQVPQEKKEATQVPLEKEEDTQFPLDEDSTSPAGMKRCFSMCN